MNNFVFHLPTELVFGKNNIENVGKLVKKHTVTNNILLTYGGGSIKSNGIYDLVFKSLEEENINYIELSRIKPNPEIYTSDAGAKLIKENNIDFILAVGGGSVLDNSKHMAIASKSELSSWELLKNPEVSNSLTDLPKIGSVITLAATGSEMNSGGVLSNPEVNEKHGWFHDECFPVFTIEDPTTLYSLPQYQRRAGVCDILSHLHEVYFGDHSDTGLTDRMVEAIMSNVIEYCDDYIENNNYDTHSNIFLSSTIALNGITKMGREHQDWTSHSVEHYVSAYTDVTHGIGLAVIHPKVLRHYYERDVKENNSLIKYVNLGKNVYKLTGSDSEIAEQTIIRIEQLFAKAGDIVTFDDEIKNKFDQNETVDKLVANNETGAYLSLNKEQLHEIYNKCFNQ